MKKPTISILHPTVRPEKALSVKTNFIRNASCPESVEYIFGFDQTNEKACNILGNHPHVKTEYRLGCINKMNEAYKVSHGDIILAVADDLACDKGWDIDITMALDISNPQVLACEDGVATHERPDLLHCFCVTRKWIELIGYCLHPEFRHVYSDDLFTAQAVHHNAIVKAPHIKFEHLHPYYGKGQDDEHYQKANTKEEYEYGEKVLAKLLKQYKLNSNKDRIL